jgi:cell division septum initiation protein DivIVA
MTEDRTPVAYLPPSGDDLVPGMVTVVEEAAPVSSAQQSGALDGFDLVLRGYDRHQVDGHLARVAVLVEQLRSELAGSVARESAATAELARVSAELERGRPSFDSLGERVSQMLGLAETEADQMRSDADRDASALRQAAEREAADIRSDARREAEELGAAARREVTDLADRRVELLSEIAHMRDALNGILAGATEQWPSLSPSQESLPTEDEAAADAEGLPPTVDEDLTETMTIDLADKHSKTRS